MQRYRPTAMVTPAASTAAPTSRTAPFVANKVTAVGKRVLFTREMLDEPDRLFPELQKLAKLVDDETVQARSNPFVTGSLFRDVDTPGVRGIVDSGIATPTITLWRIADAALWKAGDTAVCCTSDGVNRGLQRAGSAALTAVDTSAGTLTIAGNWNAVMGTTAGDYLFKSGEYVGFTGAAPTVRLEHRLGKTPNFWWVCGQSRGTRVPTLALKTADSLYLELFCDVAARVDIFVATL